MEKKVIPIIIGLLLLGTTALFAGESVKKENALKQIASVEARGFVNLVTTPGEIVYAFKSEKKSHPRAWPATCVPRIFTNSVIRLVSSVYDVFLLPWCASAINDTTPVTRHFDMPDYVWQKD
jgi:hypothetical protein